MVWRELNHMASSPLWKNTGSPVQAMDTGKKVL